MTDSVVASSEGEPPEADVLCWEVRLVEASQTSFLDRHLPQGFWSSHFALAEAHASHALAARSLRLMKGLDFLAFRSWVASWRVNRSARLNLFGHLVH